jgi:hypothetical protein
MAADGDGRRSPLKGTETLNGNRWKENDFGIKWYSLLPQATNSYCSIGKVVPVLNELSTRP